MAVDKMLATLANTLRIYVDYHSALDKPLHQIRSNAALLWVFDAGTSSSYTVTNMVSAEKVRERELWS